VLPLKSGLVSVKAQSSSWGESISADLSVAADKTSVYWLVSVDESDDSSPLVRPQFFDAADKRLALYMGPCGGNYPLEHGKQHLVDLTPVDAAGHQGRTTAPSILVDIR
jgi:hypothetical protein